LGVLLELNDFGGFPIKKEVPLVVSGCALVKDFASLLNKEAPPGYKDAEIFNKGGSPGYKKAKIFNKEWSTGNKGTDIFNKGGHRFTWK